MPEYFDQVVPEVRSGSYTQALYTGDFPTPTNDDELDRIVELYRRDAGSRLPPGEPPPAAALSPTPPPAAEPVTPEPAPVPAEDTGDYGGGGDINFGGRGPRVKPAEEPAPAPVPAGSETPTSRPSGGGKWKGEPIYVGSDAPPEAEDPSTWQEIKGGAARGVTGIGKNLGHVAGYVSKQLGKLTDSETLKQFGDSVDGFVDGLDQQARGIVPERTMGEAWAKGYGTFANWTLGKTLEGGVGMLPPLAIARYGGLASVLAYGATVSAVEEARREGSTNASVLAAAGEGAVMMGLPIKVMKMTEGQALLKRVATQAMAFAGIGAADPFVKAAVPAVAGEGYKTPTAGEVGQGAYLGGVLGAALAPVSGGAKAPAKVEPPPVTKTGEAVRGNEQYGPLPEEQGPQLPPRPYQPREDYGPDLPPRPYPPRPEESFATSDDPAFQGGPKGSPETAPPSAAGDPAATAAIDAAVNPPRSETIVPPVGESPTKFRPPPFEDPLAATRSNHEAWVEQQKQRGAQADAVPNEYETPAEARGITLNPEQQRTGAVRTARPETTTDITQPAAADALRAAEAAGYKLEPDHLDPNRQVAKNPAGEVIGKGGTTEETIADAVQRKGAPYVEEAAPTPARPAGERVELPPIPEEVLAAARPRPRATEEFTPEVKAKASRSWGDLARDDAANNTYDAPVNSNRARDAYRAAWEEAAGDEAWAARRAQDAERGTQTTAGEKPAAAAPGLRRKAQPAAAEEAITKSKAQAEAPPTEKAAPAATEAGKPTTVVTKRVEGKLAATPAMQRAIAARQTEVTVGKRGEAAVAEETPAQTEAADAAQAQQQRRLAEQRAEKLPARAQEARRTSLMADEAKRDIQDVQEAPATSKVTRGTPIEEVGEGMQIEHTAESIAETRSKTTTDKNLKYNDLLHDVLQGNKTLDEASQAAGSKEAGTRGRPRRNKDLADYLDNEVIPRAEKHEAGDRALIDQARRVLENKKTPQAKKDEQLKKLNDQLDARVTARGRQEDERANLAKIKEHRDELRGVEKKGGDAEVNAPLYRDPYVERGIKAAKRLLNLSINRKLQDRIERSEKTGTMDSVHDYLNEIINNHGAKIAAPDMVEYARHLLRLIPDHVQIGSYKALFERHGMSPEEATRAAAEKQQSAAGTYYPDASGIGLHPRAGGHLENTIHEITHGVTYDYLDHLYRKQQRGEPLTEREQKHVDALDAIVKETTRLRDEAAISDREYNELDYAVRAATEGQQSGSERTVGGRHELVSQVMSNPYVREVLGRTESSPEFKAAMKKLGYGEPATVWQAFKAFVKDIVGFKKGTVLDKVLDPLTDVLETSSQHRRAADMGVELNAPLRGSGETSGRRWKPGDVPTDGLPSQWVRDKMRPFGKEAMELNASLFSKEGVRERVAGRLPGVTRWGSKTGEFLSPTYKMTEFNEDVLPAGRKIMDAAAKTDRGADEFYNKWGDRVQSWTRQLHADRSGLGALMNEATLAKAYLTDQPGLFAQRNAHLNADEMKVAEGLRDRFVNDHTPEQQKLFSEVQNYYRETHHDQRGLEYEDVVKRFLPEATQKQIEAIGNLLSTRRGIKELIDNPQSVSPEAAALHEAFGERFENSRPMLKMIGQLQDTGFIEGSYFPQRRYGDYVLRYGELGTKHYGMERFESSNAAATRRVELEQEFAELAKTDKTAEGVRVSDVLSARKNTFGRREMMPESAFADMERAMEAQGATPEAIDQAKDAYAHARMRREVMSAQSQSRMRRKGVAGASQEAGRVLHEHFMSTGRTFGHLTEGANTTEAFRQAREQVHALERASGTPGTAADIARSKSQLDALETRFANKDPAVSKADLDHARQQHQWLEKPPSSQQVIRARTTLEEFEARRAPIGGDDSSTYLGKAAGQFTKASFVYHLARPAHLALQVAGTHAEAQSFLGARYGHAKAAAAIVRAMKDVTPASLSRGFKNGLKAFQGEMKYSDWNMREAMLNRLIKLKPGDAAWEAKMRRLDDAAADYGLVDHTQTREIQQMSRPGAFEFGNPSGKRGWTNLPSNMMNLFAVATHTVDSSMRMAILKAGFDLAERTNGGNTEASVQSAIKYAMDSMPVYGGWNTPRVASASHSPHFKELTPAVMQYKQYGLHMYANMGSLVRNAMFRPAERAEALKALAGLFATHSVLGGVTGSLMALPVVAALGAWDLFQGAEKPHDYEVDLKRAINDMVGGNETASTFASGGLFGLAGANQARSFKLSNMVDVPYLRSFDKAGAGQWIMQGMTGASGDVATQIFDGLHELTSGNPGRAAKLMLPRVFSDPWKAIDLGNEGVVDKRGRTITPASQVTLGQQAFQAAGFTPYKPSLDRQRRHAEEEYQGEYQYARKKAMDRYVLSGGQDMTAVRRYMNNEDFRRASPIKFQQLREALKEERQRERRPEFYGARPTKREERPFREATRFY